MGRAGRGSYAVIAAADEPAAVYALGHRIGRMRVTSISEKAVELTDASGKPCSLEIASGSPPSTSERPAPVNASASSMPEFAGLEDGLSTSDFERFVRRVGDGRYEVRRSFMEAVVNSIGIIPAVTASEPLLRQSPNDAATKSGFLRTFGIQDGDTIEALNGRSVRTRDDVIEAFAHTRGSSSIRLSVQRASETLTLEYALQ